MAENLTTTPDIDPRIALVLAGLRIETAVQLDAGTAMSVEALAQRLRWDEHLNMAVLPVDMAHESAPVAGKSREPLFHVLMTHSTLGHDDELVTPALSFDERLPQFQTRRANVHGTGMYGTNRREAAVRRQERADGRNLGAYLTDVLTYDEILDKRRRLGAELYHLGGMVLTELVLPRLFGERRIGKWFADKADERLTARNIGMVLLNQASRARLESTAHERPWRYDKLPPQYALLRRPVLRIGSYERPAEEPRRKGVLAMYAKEFWQAAARNARDMRRIGAPKRWLQAAAHDTLTSRG